MVFKKKVIECPVFKSADKMPNLIFSFFFLMQQDNLRFQKKVVIFKIKVLENSVN